MYFSTDITALYVGVLTFLASVVLGASAYFDGLDGWPTYRSPDPTEMCGHVRSA